MSDLPENRVPEEEIPSILERAAELDKKLRETVDKEMVRTAALEAGMSLESVNRALTEFERGDVSPARPADQKTPGWKKWLVRLSYPLFAGVGFIAGAASVSGNHPEYGLTFLVWASLAAALLAGFHRKHTSKETLVALVSLLLGTAIGSGAEGGDADIATTLTFGVVALAGSVIWLANWLLRELNLKSEFAD